MIRSQKILLVPTLKQRKLFAGAAGLSRFAWNWAVALCNRHYRMFGKKAGYKRMNAFSLAKRWAKVRDRRFSWANLYYNRIPRASFMAFDRAMKASFERIAKGTAGSFPRFHKKGKNDWFQVLESGADDGLNVKNHRIRVPRVGMVRFQNQLRWPGAKQLTARVKYKAGRWWLTVTYDLPDPPKLSESRPACGVDLGCKTFATIVSGEVIKAVPPLKPYAKAKQRLKRLGRSMSRKFKKGKKLSNRFMRAKLKLAKAHERIANLRSNYIHQLTAKLTKTYGTIVLEDLNVKNMGQGWLKGTIQVLGLGRFRRQVEYKAEMTGTKVIFADRFFPSSKMCCECGRINRDQTLKERAIWCPCGNMMDRDENAARNLAKLAHGMGEDTRGESGEQVKPKGRTGAARRTANANKMPEKVT